MRQVGVLVFMTKQRMKKRIEFIITGVSAAALTFIIAILNNDSIFGSGESFLDSAVYKYVAYMISKGYMPYKDTFDHKGPIVYLVFYLGRLINLKWGAWLIYYGIFTAFLFIVYITARRFLPSYLALTVMCIIAMNSYKYETYLTTPEVLSLPFLAMAMLVFVDYFVFDRYDPKRVFLAGVCFGIVLLIKAQMISLWIVFCVAVIIDSLRKKARALLNKAVAFLAGTAVAIAPICIWLLLRGAFADFIDDYWIFNLRYAGNYSAVVFKDHGVMDSIMHKLGTMRFFLRTHLGGSALLLSVICAIFSKRRFFDCTYIIYVILTIALAAMSGLDFGHYGTGILVASVYPMASFIQMLYDRSIDVHKWYRKVICAAGVGVLLILLGLTANHLLFRIRETRDLIGRYRNGDAVISSELKQVTDTILSETVESDLISAHGNLDIVYNLTDRMSASKYSYQETLTVDPDRYDEYYAEIENTLPKIIIQHGGIDRDRMLTFIDANDYAQILATDSGLYTVYERLGY